MTPDRSSTSPGARGERLATAVLWGGLVLGALVGLLAQPGPLASSQQELAAEGAPASAPPAPARPAPPVSAPVPPTPAGDDLSAAAPPPPVAAGEELSAAAPPPPAAADEERAAAAPPSPPPPPPPPAMPEGLAADLVSFDSTQLRSELASIALSYPEVSIARVACDGRPCAAEIDARLDAAPALDGYLAALSGRFQGFLTAEYRTVVEEGEARLRAAIVVGGGAPTPPPRYAGGRL